MSQGISSLPLDRFRLAVEACDRFEAAWKRRESPDIEEFLGGLPESDREALRQELRSLEAELARAGSLPSASSLTESPGLIGDFELLDVIGRGGMGVVYRARERGSTRIVALKMIRPDLIELLDQTAFEAVVSRFLGEAHAVGAIRHEHIVAVRAFGESGGRYYYVMDLIDGRDLAAIIGDGPVSALRAAEIVEPIARAVAHAHRLGVIHRDLKPRNILVDRSGCPFVADFGLAKLIRVDEGLTRTGELLGSPPYMAPEQVRDPSRVGPQSDIYALGATLYELVVGRPPFRAADPYETLRQVVEGDVPGPRVLDRTIPRDLETICLKCLEKDPRRRYSDADALAGDLRSYLGGGAIRARPAPAARRLARLARRRPTASTLLVAGLIVAAGLAAAWRVQVDRERRHDREVAAIDRRHAEALGAEADRTHRLLYDAEVYHAYEAFHGHRIELARQILQDQRPRAGGSDPRGFEWHYLWNQCNRDLVLRGHEGTIRALAFSPDGRTMASAGSDRVIRLWDCSTWTLRETLPGHERLVSTLTYSPDGLSLYSGGYDGRLLRWDVRAGRPPATIRGAGSGAILSAALAPDGATMALSSGDRVTELTLLDPAIGSSRQILNGHTRVVSSLAFSPDGSALAGASADGHVYLWAPGSGPGPVRTPTHPANSNCLVFERDGRSIITCGDDRQVRSWDVGSGEALWDSYPVCSSPVTSLALDEDRTVAIGHRSGVTLWDATAKRPLGELGGHVGAVRAVAFAPGSGILASAGDDGVVRLWDKKAAGPLRMAPGAEKAWAGQSNLASTPQSLAFSPDGRRIAVGYDGGTIEMRDRSSGVVIRQFSLGNAPYMVRALAFTGGGRMLAASGDLVPVRLWDVDSGKELEIVSRDVPTVSTTWWSIASAPGGRDLIFGEGLQGKPGRIVIRGTRDGETRTTLLGHDDYVRSVALSSDGRTLASGSGDETVRLWDLGGEREPSILRGHRGQVFAVAIDRDGSLAASGSEDQTVRLWDVAARREAGVLRGHTAPVHTVTFSPDGLRIASASRDGELLIWDVATRRLVAHLEGHTQRINQVAFSPEGRVLASIGYDRSIRIWDARADK